MRDAIAQAGAANKSGETAVAERKFLDAITFATEVFGESSHACATALFHTAAFYASHDRNFEAQSLYAKVLEILRS